MNPRASSGLKKRCKHRGIKPSLASAEALREGGLNNLISNALKYTEEGGMVSVHLSLVFAHDDEDSLNNQPEKQYIEISVKDTGKGIADNNIEKIFTRFFPDVLKNLITHSTAGKSLNLVTKHFT